MNKLFVNTLAFLMIVTGIASSAVAEEMILFPDQNLMDLTLIATDLENGSFSFLDRSGELQDGKLGDLVGIEEARVLEIRDIAVVAATYEEYEGYDWDGSTITRTRTNLQIIPRARIMEGGKGIR